MKNLSQQEILSLITGIEEKSLDQDNCIEILPSEIYEAMTKWAEKIWYEACEEQCEACSDKMQDLLWNSDDNETWVDEIRKTNNVEFPY